ncbi:hypothetical protein V7114_20810 [Neobacillus niacini]|uniref:hypothetical protein n=1 Tax=Neobacillus niacini TaxID=86668 RepID=UPI002FFFB4B7
MVKVKLSQLNDDAEVSIEESSTVYTVAELKGEILELGEPHHESPNWYTITRKKWVADAHLMLDRYIDCERDDMYEDWENRAWDCIESHGVVGKIQAILDEAYKTDHATAYWEYDQPVEIDIFPKKD